MSLVFFSIEESAETSAVSMAFSELWQHQLWRQLQERRRQQQLQQLDLEARQLTSHSHLPTVGKPATGNQLAATLNEMPINDAYNYMWPNSFGGGISNLPNNSQMFIAGNMNLVEANRSAAFQDLANGGIVLNDQGQSMRSIGFILNQNDQSFHGMPVPGTNSADQYSQFIGIPNNSNDLMGETAPSIAEKASFPSNMFQSSLQSATQGFIQDKTLVDQTFQGRHVFDNSSMQVLGNDPTPGNFQQAINMQIQDQFQEFHGRQEQVDLSGSLQEKTASHVGTSSGVASLDPIEQKLLFGTDNDDSWGGSLISVMGGDIHGNPLEADHYDALPSINSGSWSALMQEAVQASISDKGLQEEWSGLSFQKADQLSRTPFLATNDNGKQPAVWNDDSLQNAASLTSRPFTLFDDSNATPSSVNAPNNRHLLKSSYEEKNTVASEASHVSLDSSFQGDSRKEFLSNQYQSKLADVGNQTKMSLPSGIWAGKNVHQCENNSTDIQFKSHNVGGSWIGQQNVPTSSVSVQPVNNLGTWNSSYPIISSGNNTSNYQATRDTYVNLNSGLQTGKSDVGSPKMKAEDSSAGNAGSFRNPNTLMLNKGTHQQVTNDQNTLFGKNSPLNTYVNSEVDEVVENQNQQTRRIQPWELSRIPMAERLSDNNEKEKERLTVFPADGFVGDTAKGFFMSGSKKSSIQYGQHTAGSKVLQTSQTNLWNAAEPTLPLNHKLSLQVLPNSVFDGSNSNSVEQPFAGKSHFARHIICNQPIDAPKRIAAETEDMQSGNTTPPFVSSSSFDGSTAQYPRNETITHASSNMLELLHKVDQSRNGNSVNVPDKSAQNAPDVVSAHPHLDLSSNMRGFGLRLAPPLQRQSQPNHVPISQKPLNDNKVVQSRDEVGYQDQTQSNYTTSARPVFLNETSETQRWDKMSRQQHNVHAEKNRYFDSSSTASDLSLVGNQLREQQQLQHLDLSGAKCHLEPQKKHGSTNTAANENSVKFSEANIGARDGAVVGQSIQASLRTMAGRFSAPGVVSISENHVPGGGSQLSSGGTDHSKPAFANVSKVSSSGQNLSIADENPLSQSSTSSMSQQPGFTKMLHNVWTNISAQQRQAGINPLLTPNVLQSIINHGRDRSSWGMQKANDQMNKEEGGASPEVGTSSNLLKEGNSVQVKTSNMPMETVDAMENVDAISKSRNAFKVEEAPLKPPFDGGSSIPISSLVRLHQQDANKAKKGQDPAISSRGLHSLNSVVSSSSDIGISGHSSKYSDDQQQNYSLLHQIQSMKGSDSYINKMTGNVPKGDSVISSTSQMNSNMYQRFVDGQNLVSRFPGDTKLQAASHVSIPPDAKMLNFASSDNEEKTPGTSTAGQHDLQTHMHPLGTSSTATVLGCSEHTQINPQMAPSWFEHYGTYQNGRMVAQYDAQRSGKFAMEQHFLQKAPARLQDSAVTEQKLANSQVVSYGKSTLTTKTSPNESSFPASMLPNIIDRGTILGSKKRKSVTADMPWRKVVSERSLSLESISMAEFDWNLAANRLMEKIDDEAETMEDEQIMPQSRRRIILTTQLMHQLIPAVPTALLKGDAVSAYEGMTFYVARSTLADACRLVLLESNLHMLAGNENSSSKVEDDVYSKFVEDFNSRSKKLDADFSRWDKGASLLDVRLEWQELERFSIVNRLGKFHGRNHADVEVSSSFGTIHHRTFPQRYITALPVPRNLPEGVPCLSL